MDPVRASMAYSYILNSNDSQMILMGFAFDRRKRFDYEVIMYENKLKGIESAMNRASQSVFWL